ncbi:hypothetical protein [Numidum massiliense]|uniref:hypothetical protein n=1 Tax=Numidum massiliense TaxID=1522315 RepID=UPI0006D54642|nr:hypothetical protein [Numidum massiliense]
MRTPRKGEVVKFVASTGKAQTAKLLSLQAHNFRLCAVLEVQNGPFKGFVGFIPAEEIKLVKGQFVVFPNRCKEVAH